ncbi:MAG: squalene/phytoene synthase family protein, partial [Actinomycetia bacterium]|nr:squalene/phytoene synthase family protein [Actinomycetes bacterium]
MVHNERAAGAGNSATMDVTAAYRECERITREQARNFYWGIRLLPPVKRRALSAVYAFARRIDDIGDGELPAAEKLRLLVQARAAADDPDAHRDDPVLLALADAARRLPIPLAAFGELVDGCEMDVTGRRYERLDELVGYCRCVAGSVGRLSLGVFDPGGAGRAGGAGGSVAGRGPTAPGPARRAAERSELADALGVALQLTNILRDVREDLGNGRVYLPQRDLDLFGVTLRLAPDGQLDPQDGRLAELIRFEAARAAGWYDQGLRLLAALDRRSAACTAAMAGIYRELLTRIANDPGVIMRGRASLPA